MKASQLTPETRFFGMFIGRSKSGKTIAAASFPKPILLIDGDLRAEGILGGKRFLRDLDQIEIKRFKPTAGFIEIEKELELLSSMIQVRQNNYKTIILDSITSVNRMFLTDAHIIFQGLTKGKLRLSGPADYGYEAEACYQTFDWIRELPLNVIVTAHIIDVYGKIDPSKEYSQSVKIGERISLRDKISENIQIWFNEVYRFSKEEDIQGKLRHYVQFRSELAGTCIEELPEGRVDIIGKHFWDVLQSFKGEKNVSL